MILTPSYSNFWSQDIQTNENLENNHFYGDKPTDGEYSMCVKV